MSKRPPKPKGSESWTPRKFNCPIPSTHSRLQQAHRLWHQTADSYNDPLGFGANLNSTIEALRSVTWVLQKEQTSVPDFVPWYEAWRERMKADPILKWLIDARNRVIKQGDLAGRSSARATIRSYSDVAVLELDVPALVPTEVIALDVARTRVPQMPSKIADGLFLTVERRWVSNDLPDCEVLDALSHCYGTLSQLVRDAHERAGASVVVCDSGSGEVNVPTDHLQGQLPCMVIGSDYRTSIVSLSSGALVTPFKHRLQPDEGDLKKVGDRYKLDRGATHPPAETPDAFARGLLETAKKMLQKDKRLAPIAYLRRADGHWELHGLQPPEDHSDKAILMYLLARSVRQTGATAVIHVGEVWIGSQESAAKGYRATDAPDRKEAILASILVEGEPPRAIGVRFTRGLFGGMKFGDLEEWKVPGPFFAAAVLDEWKQRRSPETKPRRDS